MKLSATVFCLLVVIVMMTDRTLGMPPAQCNPGLLDDVPLRVRKVCMALTTMYELSSAMENYIENKVLQQNLPLPDSGVKRQDVDHVFLRFGKRR